MPELCIFVPTRVLHLCSYYSYATDCCAYSLHQELFSDHARVMPFVQSRVEPLFFHARDMAICSYWSYAHLFISELYLTIIPHYFHPAALSTWGHTVWYLLPYCCTDIYRHALIPSGICLSKQLPERIVTPQKLNRFKEGLGPPY